jgi:hypothetical protein
MARFGLCSKERRIADFEPDGGGIARGPAQGDLKGCRAMARRLGATPPGPSDPPKAI